MSPRQENVWKIAFTVIMGVFTVMLGLNYSILSELRRDGLNHENRVTTVEGNDEAQNKIIDNHEQRLEVVEEKTNNIILNSVDKNWVEENFQRKHNMP